MDVKIAENLFQFAESACILRIHSEDWTELVKFSLTMSEHFDAEYLNVNGDGYVQYETWAEYPCPYYDAIEAYAVTALLAVFETRGDLPVLPRNPDLTTPAQILAALQKNAPNMPIAEIEAKARSIRGG